MCGEVALRRWDPTRLPKVSSLSASPDLVLLNRLYLGNPMDPPDLLSVELSTSRPTQHLGRVKSKSPSVPGCFQFTGYPEPAVLLWGQWGQGSRWDSWIPGSGWMWGESREAAVSAVHTRGGAPWVGPALALQP